MRGRVLCGPGGVCVEAGSGRVRSNFRTVLRWPGCQSDRDLVGFEADNNGSYSKNITVEWRDR